MDYQHPFSHAVGEVTAQLVTLRADNQDKIIASTLQKLGTMLGVDRGYLFCFSENLAWMSNTHEWCAEGIEPQIERIQNVPTDTMPWWKEKIAQNKPVLIPAVSDLPLEAQQEREEFSSQGIQSLVCLPMIDERGHLIGFMGFDAVRKPRSWLEQEIEMLSLMAHLLAVAMGRSRAEVALRENVELLARSQQIAHLGSWKLDVPANRLHWSDEVYRIFGCVPQEFEATYEVFLSFVHPDDRAAVDAAYTRSVREKHDGYEIEHRIIRKDTGEERFVHEQYIHEFDDVGAVIRSIGMVHDITERKRAEEMLRHSYDLFQYIVEHMRSAVAVHDRNLNYIYVSQQYLREYKVKEKDIVGKHHYEVFPDLPQKWRDAHQRALAGEVLSAEEDPYFREDGSVEWTRWECRPWYDQDGSVGGIIVYTEVITERKRAEEEREKLQTQLIQAQKMEAVGRLAGGVAHDFNNMLTVILGGTEMAMEEAGGNDQLRNNLFEIQKAATRSADLTRQLLAFARRQTVAPKAVDINETVEGMLEMLLRLIGEDIHLIWRPGDNLYPVFIDPAQVDQILVNLCVNARDAIAGAGKITVETDNVCLDEAHFAKHAESVPGEFVMLAVSDNGCGMDTEVLGQLFEPFFTTKGVGKGTGLGLSTVDGIVRQNKGFIDVYSEPGHGTTFKIYLPQHAEKTAPKTEQKQAAPPEANRQVILLVEDESAILKMTTLMLEGLGYTVIAASTPGEAIRLAREYEGQIDLLITDVIMPEMNGRDLARNIISIFPEISRLFMSGYTADVIAHHGVLDAGVHFIQKPFSMNALAAKILEALDRGS